jgi:hypothetical protein
MAISEAYAGTETVSTTEWSLTSDSAVLGAIATDGIYQVFLELNNLDAGDVFEFKVYEKVLSGDQGEPVFVTPSLILMHGWEMTLDKISGTDRAISWSIRSVA